MASITTTRKSGPLVLAGPRNGVTVIPSPTPLTRLNYFDGKFLRAQDLRDEQEYVRALVRLSNQAGGHGVAHGFDLTHPGGDAVKVGQGLAINADGQVILLPAGVTLDIGDLIEQTRQLAVTATGDRRVPSEFGDCVVVAETPPGQVLESGDLYVITAAPADALCGEEDVFGRLCEEACVTSTDRPYRVEGVIFRARPLLLRRPLPVSQAFPFDQRHLRSRVAAAYFDGERDRIASHISKAGLESAIWCLGAQADAGAEVPLGVVSRSGGAVAFLDTWIVRRERIDTVAKRYWQWRMAMRPWDVFLAHILQFQCHLHDLFRTAGPDGGDDPCRDSNTLVTEASDRFTAIAAFYERASARLVAAGVEGLAGGLGELTAFQSRLVDRVRLIAQPRLDRRLLRGGIVELPSAGYLPVIPGSGSTINTQVRQWMGEGVDLRFCVVRPDYVPHAIEEAQHMERISLTQGLDNPRNKPQVDILVPNGEILKQERRSPGTGYEALIQFGVRTTGLTTNAAAAARFNMQGAARTDVPATGGAAVYAAAATQSRVAITQLASALANVGRVSDTAHIATLQRLSADAVPAPEGGVKGNPALFTRLTTLAADALRYTTARRATAAGGTGATVFQPNQAADDRTAAIWTQASIEHNPFTMEAGGTTRVDARLSLVMPAAQASLFDLRIRGDFQVDQPAIITGNARTVRGTISAQVTVRTTTTTNTTAQIRAIASVDTVGRKFALLLDLSDRVALLWSTTWQDQPQVVDTEVVYRVQQGDGPPTSITLLRSRFTENNEVLEAGNVSHSAALSALEVVGAALDDPRFADNASRLLFPPPPPPAQELLVRGTLDWVLFHRRRTKTCADEPVRTAVAARRYRVYHLRSQTATLVVAIRRALLENDAAFLERVGFAQVGTVEFAAGGPAINTPVTVVRSDWNSVNPASRVVYGAIASQGGAVSDGNSLAVARLGRYQGAIATISEPHLDVIYETIPVVPGPLSAAGLDGSIALVTLDPEVRTVCHTVLRTTTRVEEVIRVIQTGGVTAAIGQQLATQLGTVTFLEHTATVEGNGISTITAAWTAQGGGVVFDASFVSTEGDTSETAAARASQALAITAAITAGITPRAATSPSPLGVTCTTVTILRAADAPAPPTPAPTRTGRVLVWTPQATGAGRVLTPMRAVVNVTFQGNGAQDALSTAALAELRRFPQVTGVELFTREGTPDAAAAVRLRSHMDSLAQAGLLAATAPGVSGPLNTADAALLPANAATAQDIVFLRLAPTTQPIGSPQRKRSKTREE